MDTDSFIHYIKTEEIYEDIEKNVETRLDTSNYELNRPSLKGKNKKINWIDEKWIRQKSKDKVYSIEIKNIQLFIKRTRWKEKQKAQRGTS